jgi:hypothetical protein
MVMEFLCGGRIRQCEQAGARFNRFDCCDPEGGLVHGGCDEQGIPEFEKWGFDFVPRTWHATAKPNGEPLSWTELTNEIWRGRPFLFTWVEDPVNSEVSHMLVLIGYEEPNPITGIGRMVYYIDPLIDPETDAASVPFSYYTGESPEHPHRDDYFKIGPRAFP